MKIGVALSGCDIGGICAGSVLSALKDYGVDIGMISACCVPAATSLLYAHGCDEAAMLKISSKFLDDTQESDIDFAVANLAMHFSDGPGEKIPIAVNAVNVSDGAVVTFTNDCALFSAAPKAFDIEDTYDVLSATISFVDGLGSYCYEDLKLCDFCCWYGCPLHQLKLAGYDKIISIAFVPKHPKTPYEVLVKQMITSTSGAADVHIPIEFEGQSLTNKGYVEFAKSEIKGRADEILLKTLF